MVVQDPLVANIVFVTVCYHALCRGSGLGLWIDGVLLQGAFKFLYYGSNV